MAAFKYTLRIKIYLCSMIKRHIACIVFIQVCVCVCDNLLKFYQARV